MSAHKRRRQMVKAALMRTGELVFICKRDESGALAMTVVEPEEAETWLHVWGDGAFVMNGDWWANPKEDT